MIRNKKLVNKVKNQLLNELEIQFKDQNSNLVLAFKNEIKKAINNTSNKIIFTINNLGGYK
tara:strand:- start:195 stop:377 length:183 start_codon:yes stop_codon:yes gene_type:complete